MGEKETYTITSDSGVTLAIVPASFMELYKNNVYKLLRDEDKPERVLIDIIENECHLKLDTEEAVKAANEIYSKKGFITVADYIVYRMCEYIRTTLPNCGNCSLRMESADGYCPVVGAPVQETCSACPQFTLD